MPTPPSTPPSSRSVKIGADERTGWSSERPRREGAPPRPVDVSVRSRVLRPSDRLVYSPGSLLLVTGAKGAGIDAFLDRVIEEKGIVFSLDKVRGLLAGRVPEEHVDARARELLDTAVSRRIAAGQSVVVALETLDPAERNHFVLLAHGNKRPRHLLLVETPREGVTEDERAPLDELRRGLDANELGVEGFHTMLRISGNAISELKRIVFRPLSQD
jgi:predicted kinase